MSDENQESSSALGSAGSPTSSASQSANVQPTSGFDADHLLKQVESLIEKKVQSVKDRRFDEMGKRLGDAETVLERVKGLIPADKFRELEKDLEFEALKKQVYGTPSTGAPAVGNQQASAAVETDKVIAELGLPQTDPEVILLKTQNANALEFAKLAVRKAKSPQPSDADRPATPASPVVSSLTPQEIEKKAAELRAMYKKPSQYRTQINALEKELEAYLPK